MALGIGYVPEDRKEHGLVLAMSIADNVTLPVSSRFARLGWLNAGRERQAAATAPQQLEVKMASVEQKAGNSPAATSRRWCWRKWLGTQPARADPRRADARHRRRHQGGGACTDEPPGRAGLAILMISSELPEVLGMSDRILVMREGRLTGQFSRAEATQEKSADGPRPDEGDELEANASG